MSELCWKTLGFRFAGEHWYDELRLEVGMPPYQQVWEPSGCLDDGNPQGFPAPRRPNRCSRRVALISFFGLSFSHAASVATDVAPPIRASGA